MRTAIKKVRSIIFRCSKAESVTPFWLMAQNGEQFEIKLLRPSVTDQAIIPYEALLEYGLRRHLERLGRGKLDKG